MVVVVMIVVLPSLPGVVFRHIPADVSRGNITHVFMLCGGGGSGGVKKLTRLPFPAFFFSQASG